jgi:hypothetical protein
MDSILTNAFPRIQIEGLCAVTSQGPRAFRNAASIKPMPWLVRDAHTR